jgi:hypothetical protein
MHEASLGYSIQDYISGKDVEATTYEDLRQAIAKMLVEQKGYPKDRMHTKLPISFAIDGQTFSRSVDLVVYDDEDEPLMVVFFCAGEVETYVRECIAAARLLDPRPAKLAVATDTKQAVLLRVQDGERLDMRDYQALPEWRALLEMGRELQAYQPSEAKRKVEERLLYAFSELSCGCGPECPPEQA